MADRRAIASGFSLSDIETGGGCVRKVARGGGRTCLRVSKGSMGASCATETVGVMGETGGRAGDCDLDRTVSCLMAAWSLVASNLSVEGTEAEVEDSEGEVGRVVVGEGMVKAGMMRRRGKTSPGLGVCSARVQAK